MSRTSNGVATQHAPVGGPGPQIARSSVPLVVADLTVKYGDFTAVKGISFEAAPGELIALLGPSGCGKTTTLRCIGGLEGAHRGSIRIGDTTVVDGGTHVPPHRRNVNMVFQSYAIWPHLSVLENVRYGVRKAPGGRERALAALEMVGLHELRDRYPSALSGGQQQRVALARAIVTEPSVLLFDEPLSNLDAALRIRMRSEVRDVQRRLGITSVYVTHDQEEAMAIADRIILMRDGVIEQLGTPREIFENPATKFAADFLGSANTWPGTVRSAEGPALIVDLDLGETCEAAVPGGQTFLAGDRVAVLARPERIQIAPDAGAEGASGWRARVLETVYLGGRVRVVADLHGETAEIVTQDVVVDEPGADVRLVITPGSLVAVPD